MVKAKNRAERAAPVDVFEPNYHGYAPEQIELIEEARHDDTPEPPEPEAPPVLTNIDPDTAAIGDPDITMTVTGSGFQPNSTITFNGGAEATVFVSDSELTTVVKPSTATTAGTYPVTVRNGELESVAADFTFTDGAARGWADPDELEDDIEQAEEEGEFKSTHTAKPKTKKK